MASSLQVADSQFSAASLGHEFVLRCPLAKATAARCRDCGANVFEHARSEVSEKSLLSVLNATADTTATEVAPGVFVGGFQAAISFATSNHRAFVLNCAGTRLHSFLPKSRGPMDAFRAQGRLKDLEWDDSDEFELDVDDVKDAVAWVDVHIREGSPVVINCAQGKSRSGTMACAYLVATLRVSVDTALARIQATRPFVQPNEGFMRQLRMFEARLQTLFVT